MTDPIIPDQMPTTAPPIKITEPVVILPVSQVPDPIPPTPIVVVPPVTPYVASNTPYILAVIFMLLIAVTGIVVITVSRPGQDNTAIIAAIFGFLTPTTLSLLAFMKAQETHLSVNSRLETFIAASKAQGIVEGRQSANLRTDALAQQASTGVVPPKATE